MKKALFLIAILSLVALAAPAVAQPAGKAPPTSSQPPELSAFLASLAPGTAVPAAKSLPPVSSCLPNYCNELKAECVQDCLPCVGRAVCYYYICDAFCQCYC